jgi:hypothetical protein
MRFAITEGRSYRPCEKAEIPAQSYLFHCLTLSGEGHVAGSTVAPPPGVSPLRGDGSTRDERREKKRAAPVRTAWKVGWPTSSLCSPPAV